MNIGAAAWSFGPEVDALRIIAHAGLRSAQIDLGGGCKGPYLGDRRNRALFKDAAKQLDVRLTAIGGSVVNDLGLVGGPDSATFADCRSVIAAALEAAAALQVPLVFFPSFRRSSIHTDSDLLHTADHLQWACRRGQADGTIVASENDLSPDMNARLVEAVNEPNFRLVLDTYNPCSRGISMGDLVPRIFDLIADQVHVKDGMAGTGGASRLSHGDGGVEHTVRDLVSNGFSGTWILESDYRQASEARLRHDLAVLRAFIDSISD